MLHQARAFRALGRGSAAVSRLPVHNTPQTFFSSSDYSRRVFVDKARIQVKGGPGGNGCASFARTIYGIGAPDGGNGGRGGDIYLHTDPSLLTFSFSRFHFNGNRGANGGPDALHGARGTDTIINIPPGTLVKEVLGRDEAGELVTQTIADLAKPDMKLLVSEGAVGGLGNKSFKTADRPKATLATIGDQSKPRRLLLELKVIADVGLVGYPNAGKSSFLKAVSRAAPKVAAYPFTTLHPMVANVRLNDAAETTYSIADLPGLVDGAHMGVGLGHEFLRHIERTKVLLYVIDIARPLSQMRSAAAAREEARAAEETKAIEYRERRAAEEIRLNEEREDRERKRVMRLRRMKVPEEAWEGITYEELFSAPPLKPKYEAEEYDTSRPRGVTVTDLGDPVAEFLSLRKELALFNPALAARPAVVLANKADTKPAACAAQLQRLRRAVPAHWPLFVGSAKESAGLEEVLVTLGSAIHAVDEESKRVADAMAARAEQQQGEDDGEDGASDGE